MSSQLKELVQIVAGCETRHRTIAKGVAELDRHKIQVTIIHDAVRPLVSVSLLQQLVAAAVKYGAAGPVTKLTSTVVSRDENGFLDQVLTRNQYFDSQMPQVFQHEAICEAYCNSLPYDLDNGTECLDLVQKYSSPKFRIKLIEGDPNVLWKVTHRKDLMLTGLALHDSDMEASHVVLHSEACDDRRSDRLSVVQKVEECVNTFCETISSSSCSDLRESLHEEESATLTCVCLRFCSCMEEFASQVRELESWSESCRSLLLIIVFEGNQEHGSSLTPFFRELEKLTAGSSPTAVLYFLNRSQVKFTQLAPFLHHCLIFTFLNCTPQPKVQQATKRDAFYNLVQLILLKPKVFSGQVLFV